MSASIREKASQPLFSLARNGGIRAYGTLPSKIRLAAQYVGMGLVSALAIHTNSLAQGGTDNWYVYRAAGGPSPVHPCIKARLDGVGGSGPAEVKAETIAALKHCAEEYRPGGAWCEEPYFLELNNGQSFNWYIKYFSRCGFTRQTSYSAAFRLAPDGPPEAPLIASYHLFVPDGPSDPECTVGNPIDVTAGVKLQSERDFQHTHLGAFDRLYRTGGGTQGTLGTAWRHSYERDLEVIDLRGGGGNLRQPLVLFGGVRSSQYPSAEDACVSGWAEIHGRVRQPWASAASPRFEGGNCKLTVNGLTVWSLPVTNPNGGSKTNGANTRLVQLPRQRSVGRGPGSG